MYELFMAVSASIDKTKMTKLYSLHVLFWNLFCSTYIRKTKKNQGLMENFDWNVHLCT